MKIILAILCSLWGLSAVADEIRLTGSPYCPLICEGESQGFMVDIVEEVFTAQGYDFIYENNPRSRSLEMVNEGEFHGLIGQIAGFDTTYHYPALETALIELCFFTDASSAWQYDGLASLQAVSLGLIKDYGYAAVPDAKKHIERYGDDPLKISYIVGDKPMVRILKMISLGRVSATLEDRNIVNYLLKEHAITSIRNAGCADTRINSFVVFPRNEERSAEYASIMGEGMQAIRASGRLDEILARYGASDWR